jgi:general secretion pathway protein B
MEELILDNRITIPQLHLDIHVYSDDPAERFVFINMARYNEGQPLKEGPVLLAINPAGVVLRHQGYDFLVTRE